MMLANFFGKSKPINIIILIIVFFALYLLVLFSGKVPFQWSTIPLFLLMFALVNFITGRNNLTLNNSYMFLVFMLMVGFFPKVIIINRIFYINAGLLLFLRKVYSFKSPKTIFNKLFDAGFFLGICFLLEPFTLIFVLLLYASMYLFNRLNFQTLFIPAIGFFTPVFLYFTYCFWCDKIDAFQQLFLWFTDYDYSLYKHKNYLLSILFLGVFLLMSIIVKTPKALAVQNLFKASWMLVLLHLALAVFLILLIKNRNGSEFLFALLPASIILANGLELYRKKKLIDIVIIAFFIVSIIVSST